MSTINDTWESYWQQVIPRDAPDVQIQESRRAYYAGASAMLRILKEIGEDRISEDEGVATLERLDAELRRFVADVKAGLA